MDNRDRLREQREEIMKGLEKSYEKLVEFKRYKKSPLIVEKDGVILEIPPENIPPTTKYKIKKKIS